jgi:DNA-directed RNA polymerase subunit RPC12/RpoP
MANREADRQGDPEGGSVLVCMTCGRESPGGAGRAAPGSLRCDKCGSQVFRSFDDGVELDEVRQDFEDETGRDLNTDDPAGDAVPGDLHDLNS